MEAILENIRVAVIFGPGNSMRPIWFDWRRQKYTVRQITYTWQDRQGETTVLHFAVSDGATLFELAYHTGNLMWLLTAVEPQAPIHLTGRVT